MESDRADTTGVAGAAAELAHSSVAVARDLSDIR